MKRVNYTMVLCIFVIGCLVGLSGAGMPIRVYDDNHESLSPAPWAEREIIVKFSGDTDALTIRQINSQYGTSVLSTSRFAGFKRLRILSDTTVLEMVERYSRNPHVEYAEPNYIACATMVPNDSYYYLQWHMDNSVYGGIHMENAWDASNGGSSSVIVAIIDTGVAYENYGSYYLAPDLAQTNFVAGYDFSNNDSHANDDNSHGTHVAGTVAQSTNNNLGVAGVAYNTSIMPVKVLNRNGSGYYSDIADGIYFAADNGADVINMSLGGTYNSSTLRNACSYAYNHGVTIVASAGNNGNNGPKSYPAAYDDYVIAVSATRYDEDVTSYSNTGSYVDIAAPGGDTGVDQNGDGYSDGVLQQTFNPNTKDPSDFSYWFFQGTSMASPHVAGVAALVIAGGITGPDAVREAIEATAEDHGQPGWDSYYGWGIVDAYAAVNYGVTEEHDVAVTAVDAPSSAMQGDVIDVDVHVANYGDFTETFDVTLTDLTDSVLIGSSSVTLAAGETDMLTFTWDTGSASITTHELEGEAAVVPDETNTSNNAMSAFVEILEIVHDVAVTAVDAPAEATIGDIVPVTVTVENTGTFDETITVHLTDITDSDMIGSETVFVASGGSAQISFDWDTQNSSIGDHTLRAEADPVPGETNLFDNSMDTIVTLNEESGDVVTITRADYKVRWGQLIVEATSSEGSSVTLTVHRTSDMYEYGEMYWNWWRKKFRFNQWFAPDPDGYITVKSSGGGEATRAVKYK
jgi:serine protease